MKSVKKIFAAVMATAIVSTTLAIPVSADSYETTGYFEVEEKTITMNQVNDNIVVSFSLTNNCVFNSGGFEVFYNPEELQLEDIEGGSDVGAKGMAVANTDINRVTMVYTPTKLKDAQGITGKFVEFTFKIVDPNPQPGDKYDISVRNFEDIIQQYLIADHTLMSPVKLTNVFDDGFIKIQG